MNNMPLRGLRQPVVQPPKKKKKQKPLDPNKPGVSISDGVRSIKQGYKRRKNILDSL